MRHDYDLPAGWHSMSPAEKDQWFHEERCRRQALSQDTPWAAMVKRVQARLHRRAEAHPAALDARTYR